jgi:hypothetical protein
MVPSAASATRATSSESSRSSSRADGIAMVRVRSLWLIRFCALSRCSECIWELLATNVTRPHRVEPPQPHSSLRMSTGSEVHCIWYMRCKCFSRPAHR